MINANDVAPMPDDRPLYPPPAAPLAVAREIYDKFRLSGQRTLIAWRGGWMRWQGTHWSEIEAAEMRSHIYPILGDAIYEAEVKTKAGIEIEERPWNPDKRKIAHVMEAMAAVGHISSDIDTPAWIGIHNAAEKPATQMVSCLNGILDLTTRTLIDHTPALFNVVTVPFDYDGKAPAPKAWLEFLATLWPDDPESVELLQEYIGYVLSGRTDMQKMLMLIGPTRSGKGTIARMVTELVGRLNAAGPTMASLGTNFGLSPLMGKPLAIISDARLGDTPSHLVVERLLSITGEDMLTVDRKFRDPWSGKLPTRFVVLSNELPKFRDSSGAIANRMLILQMNNSFLGREDRTLDDRIKAELPGILLWALEGLDRLDQAGKFTIPESSRDAANLMMDLASPMSAFVRERCDRTPTASVPVDDLFHAWKEWAEENGHQAGAKSTFGRNLRSVVPALKISEPRAADGTRLKRYTGIGLADSYGCNADLPTPPAPKPGRDDDQGVGAGYTHANAETKTQVKDTGAGGVGKSPLQRQQNGKSGSGVGTAHATAHANRIPGPPCHLCGRAVVGGQKDDQGRFAHLSCQTEAALR